MPQKRQHIEINLAYAEWHRRESTKRFVGIEKAQNLAMIDQDSVLWVEYDDKTKEPLALIEAAEDKGQDVKPTTVMRRLAKRCDPMLPAYVVLYKTAKTANPAAPNWPDIESFRVQRVWPPPIGSWSTEKWRNVTPQGYAEWLVKLRLSAALIIDDAPARSILSVA